MDLLTKSPQTIIKSPRFSPRIKTNPGHVGDEHRGDSLEILREYRKMSMVFVLEIKMHKQKISATALIFWLVH